jgi:hypothetical protein
MSDKVEETTALKLYTDYQGTVWYINKKGMPECSDRKASEFCNTSKLLKSCDTVMTCGDHKNSELIYNLYIRKRVKKLGKLQVCSPKVEYINLPNYSPENVLLNMRRWQYAASAGGFHEVSQDEFYIYTLTNMMTSEDLSKVSEKVKLLYSRHPLHEIASFVPGIDHQSCALLAGLIIDPRWFFSPAHPDGLTDLYKYFGLDFNSSKKDDGVLDAPNSIFSKASKRKIVIACWKNYFDTEDKSPENFIAQAYWAAMDSEIVAKAGKDGTGHSEDMAEKFASRKFLEFVYRKWLMYMYPDPTPWKESVFVPELFFKSKEQLEAYRKFFK